MHRTSNALTSMSRTQFSLRSLLWLTALVAAFFGGAAWQRQWMIRHGWFEAVEAVAPEPVPAPAFPTPIEPGHPRPLPVE